MSFDFGDEVRIISAERTPDLSDKVGLIVGIAPDEGSGASYAVSFPDVTHTASFWESELELAATPRPR